MTFADIVSPVPGERVVEVPQADSYLLGWGPSSVIGLSVRALEPHIAAGAPYGCPRWKTYEPLTDPGWGYGLIVVREGRCYRGPCQWDSGD